jgi:hypothetical protein
MPVKDILEHEDIKFIFEQLSKQTIVLAVHQDDRGKCAVYLNREACIALATYLLNAAKGLES